MESVGQKLRDARLRQGLTLEQISADTRLSLKNLIAIEADDLSSINSSFFYRSFVRQFASKVKLDYETIADGVRAAASTIPEPLIPGQGKPRPIHVAALKMPRRRSNFRWLRSVVSFCIVLIACSGAYAIWQNPYGHWQDLLAQINSQFTARNTNVIAGSSAKPRMSGPATPALTLESKDAGFHLQLAAVERTWLSIVADGRQIFNGELSASETKALEGHESARIRTGNAGGLNITFNGKDIGILGPRGQIRTVVFTKDHYRVLPSVPEVALTTFIQNAEY